MAYEIWFRLDGVEGGAIDGARRGWSPVVSFSQSVQNAHGNGQPFQFCNLMRKLDRSSPVFARAAAEGRHFREALIEIVTKDAVLRLRLQDVTIQNYSFNGSSTDPEAAPMEGISLEASKAEWVFAPETGRELKSSWPPEGAALRPARPVEV